MSNNWSANQRVLQEWLALPSDLRDPATQYELAERLHVNEATLSRWKRGEGFMDEVRSIAKTFLRDDLPEIYAAIGRKARSGDYQMARLALELVGDLQTQGTSPASQHVLVEYVNDWRGQ